MELLWEVFTTELEKQQLFFIFLLVHECIFNWDSFDPFILPRFNSDAPFQNSQKFWILVLFWRLKLNVAALNWYSDLMMQELGHY